MKCEAAALSYNLHKYTNIKFGLRGIEAKNLSPKGNLHTWPSFCSFNEVKMVTFYNADDN